MNVQNGIKRQITQKKMKNMICCWCHMLSHMKQNRLMLGFLTQDVPTICVAIEVCSRTWMRALFI
jgi:hypothetical protein